jgi:hypothetical protein
MRHPFKASSLIGLLALAFGLTAFDASVAQAEPGAFWEVNGAVLTKSASAQAKNDTFHNTFITTVGTSKVEILCGPIKFVSMTLAGTGASGKIHYGECEIFLNGALNSRCTPKSPGASLGLIESNPLKGLLKLHELPSGAKDDILELSPESGTAFFTLETGALCPIGSKFDITGSRLALKDCKNELLINKIEHLFEEDKELPGLLFGGNPMIIDGSFWMFLNGSNLGQTFSGHPA